MFCVLALPCTITNKIFLVSCWTACLSRPEIIDFSFDFLRKRIKPYFSFGNKPTWFFSLKNVRLILDIMSYTDKKKVPGVALFIDFRKAFDTIEWDFLIDTLDKFNFGPDVRN